MPLFNRPGDPTLSLQEFVSFLQGTQAYRDYVAKFRSAAAQAMTLCIYDSEAKRKDQEGYWSPDISLSEEAFKQAAPPGGVIKFKKKTDVQRLNNNAQGVLALDGLAFDVKKKQLQKILTNADTGSLSRDLKTHQEPEAQYYDAKSWNAMTVQEKKAAWPPTPPKDEDLQKIKSWLESKKTGPTAPALVDALSRKGKWPLGQDDTVLNEIWKQVAAAGAPLYRLPPSHGLYTSSVLGRELLRFAMRDLASKAQNLKSPKSQDWSLCAFGCVMAAQGFTDGNKRTARVAYAIVMASAGLAFKAPDNVLGSRLAGM